MKFMIASDLHGSYEFGKLLFERFDEEQPVKLLLLGDLLYHGARNALPNGYDTITLTKLLNAHKESILAVRGNCDAEIDQMVLEFPIMSDYLQLYVDGRPWFVTHGHVYDEHTDFPYEKDTVLLHGHTHVKVMQRIGKIWYMNPGSTSIPKDGSVHSYMTYEDGVFTIKDITNGAPLMSYKL